jgi:hypothetical protein
MSADPGRMRQVDLDEPVTQLIVQFRIHGHGSIRDLDFRHHLEDVLQAALQQDDLGMVDGGDIGSGSVNVFAFVDPDRWEPAWATVRSKLADMELLQRAVVARQVDDSDPEVVWPEGTGQKFRYWEEPHNYLA